MPRRCRTLRAPGRPATLELDGVSKVFTAGDRPVTAVEGLSLSLPAGAAMLVTGPSGSGKTTLLGLAGCLIRPTTGRIRVAGRETTRLPEELLAELRRRQFGFIFQSYHLIPGASALVNVMLPALPSAEVDGNLRPHACALLARFGLAGRAHERVERLSGGEQQRVAIARALINDPPVILADEPTAHLDAGTAEGFLDLLAELRAQGRTVLVASHDPLVCDSGCFTCRLELRCGRPKGDPAGASVAWVTAPEGRPRSAGGRGSDAFRSPFGPDRALPSPAVGRELGIFGPTRDVCRGAPPCF